MNDMLLRKARDLKRRSRTLRDQGDFDGAENLLLEAVSLLRGPVESAMGRLPPGVPAAEDWRELATELADCWGSLGGVRRRRAETLRREGVKEAAARNLEGALQAYDSGLQLEADDRFRIANSYNLVQRVVVPILSSPGLLGDSALTGQLSAAEDSIKRQIATSRSEDPWAYSDLGLIQLLRGDEVHANDSWDQMDALKPLRNVYTSGLPVLESLAEALPGSDSLRRGVSRFRAAV